ncbi:holo-ACP synthase [Erysipelothrix urinaevulpis]|uniref:holo-ACP synthase n=1 Tax=Erysipelothrix urinaevulpis TaxID=2683717 RepID=UPI00135A5D92|nr:holo-ACP synthase [Erysipelothrix urinaevulpis]
MGQLSSQSQIKIGTDIVYIPRFNDKINNQKWINRILTPNEILLFNNLNSKRRKLEFFSGRFAAKEAYSKVLGTGIGHCDFHDIEILYDTMGKPISNKMEVSISHDEDYTIAMVMVYEKV